MSPQQLDDEWRALKSSVPFDTAMRFGSDGLVLGHGTVLCRASRSSPRQVVVDTSEQSLLTLLAAAHLQPPSIVGLSHLQRAAERRREGQDALASMHLALSGLDRLKRPIADARRLFFADRLLKGGLPPETIINALDLASLKDGTLKYSPDQPRVAAGSGRTSGEWTTGADSSSAQSNPAPTSGSDHEHGSRGRDKRKFVIDLPPTIVCARVPIPTTPFTQAVKALGDAIEVTDTVTKWRELGPRGEAEIAAAVEAKGWILLGTQVRVQTDFGLRIEDVMVHVPAGTAGNETEYDGFIEVKVNGGRYSAMQQMKDTSILTDGGVLLTPVKGGYVVGRKLFLGTGLANATITYEPKE